MKNILYILLLFSVSLTAQVRPNQFIEETSPDSSNFEVYSQKNGLNRRANIHNLKQYFDQNLSRNGDTLFLSKALGGDTILISGIGGGGSASGGVNLGNGTEIFKDTLNGNLRLRTIAAGTDMVINTVGDTVIYISTNLSNINSQRLRGRVTAGNGPVEEIAIGSGLQFNGSTLEATGAGAQDLTGVLTQGNDAGGTAITNLGAPTNSGDAATKAYVDANPGGGGGGGSLELPDSNHVYVIMLGGQSNMDGRIANSSASASEIDEVSNVYMYQPASDTYEL